MCCAKSARAAADFAPVHYRLANGLEVLLAREGTQPRVAVLMAYEVGARDDPPGLAGLAHLVEHVSFRPSLHTPAGKDRWHLLERAGATGVNGFTSQDFSAFTAVVPNSALPLALWVERERMAFTLEALSVATVELEHATIARELTRRSHLLDLFDRLALNAFYGPNHLYFDADAGARHFSQPPLGAVRWLYQRAYRPDNARLVLVGNFDVEQAKHEVERYFGDLANPKRPFVRVQKPLPALPARSVTFSKANIIQGFFKVWALPALEPRQRLAAQVLAIELERTVRKGLAAQAKVVDVVLALNDLCPSLRLKVVGEDVDWIEAAVEKIIQKLTLGQLRDSLPSLKRTLARGLHESAESISSQALLQLQSLRRDQRPFRLAERLSQVDALEPELVAALARRLPQPTTAYLRRSSVGGPVEVDSAWLLPE